jgi:type II restriction/modification system DNA methylase subunit YeeA
MTPEQFIDKWSRTALTERSAAQQHFLDLCDLLGEQKPAEADPTGEFYTFEKGATKTDGSGGFADVWKRGCFGWEYKKDKANLDRAYQQLQLYSVALENPPLLVVADTKVFRVYTNWTNTVQDKKEFKLEDLAHTDTRELLRNVFRNPERLRPAKTRKQVTEDAAKEFVTIAERLRTAGNSPESVAHFLNRLVFCLFAEDVNLLPDDLFKRLLDTLAKRRDDVKERSQKMLSELFANMRKGGQYGLEHILHFNGGLFDTDDALSLDANSLDVLRNIAKQDWSAIDPTIFGTLFERFLDPDKRAQIGAHYTDPEKIMMIVEPVIERPLKNEWEAVKADITDILSKGRARDGGPGKAAINKAEIRLDEFLKRLANVRILDPACGSGNFLYMALQSLKDLEHRIILDAETMGLARRVLHCGPENVKGLEINAYAAELARTTIWIGDIQWKRRNGFEAKEEPVLRPLDAIECRDALVARKEDGSYGEARWPEAEFIIGNPPFLGNKKMIEGLGEFYVQSLRAIYDKRISGGVDLVTYWFVKSWEAEQSGRTKRAGLVATNSIRSGASREILKKIVEEGWIFNAWDDEEWTVEGAQVRVSIICFSPKISEQSYLNGQLVTKIHPNLTAASFDVTSAKPLAENNKTSFVGVILNGEFEVEPSKAREWLRAPANVNSRPNSDVLRPTFNGDDFNGERNEKWVVDFGTSRSEKDSAQYELPFQYILSRVKPYRQRRKPDGSFIVRATSERNIWWRHARSRPGMRKALAALSRYIATPMVSSYRTFDFLHSSYLADQKLVVFARDDWTFFGLLHSEFHLAWTLKTCAWIGAGNDVTYSNQAVFLTFPFPEGLTPNIPAKDYADDPRAIVIARAAKRLDELRKAWLNPPELIDIVPEIVAGYPDRTMAKNANAAVELKKRTLNVLYNQRPQWLTDAHRVLDAAVASAYGWPADISEEEALAKLMKLNTARSSTGELDIAIESEMDDEDE